MAAPAAGKARDLAAEIAFLTRALKAPALRESRRWHEFQSLNGPPIYLGYL